MSTPISPILKELHRLRKHLRDLQTEIDLGPRVMKIQQQKLAAEEQAHRDAHDTLKRLKIKQKEDEVSLKETEQRLLKLQADMNMAGSKKEYDAKQSEIDQANARKGEFEDAILAAMAEIEERLTKLRSPFRSAETFWIEEIIDPRDTRPLLCEFANLAAPLRRPGPSMHRMRP
jgi:predicted  nucleic acid-binding Zn-ribbon protein